MSIRNDDETRLDPLAVCTLPPSRLAERRAWVRGEVLSHAVASERGEDWIAWEFSDTPELAAKLDAWVAAETACCAPINFVHEPLPERRRRRLAIRDIDPGSRIFELARAGPGDSPRRRRSLRAAAIGAGAGAFLCCVLPIAVAALSASAAAKLAALDDPLIVAAVAGLAGAAAYAWQRRN